MIMSFYPEGAGEHLPMKVGKNTPTLYVNINIHRWQQIKVFNTCEEFEKWKDNHPWSWHVIAIAKIEELNNVLS